MKQEHFLTILVSLAALALMLMSAGSVHGQVAGSATTGIGAEEMKVVALGWSAKKQILGKDVYNDTNQKIGVIDDLIITPDKAVSFAIIGAGGFLGVGKHDVAIPVSQLKPDRDKFILPGATRDRIKAMPEFEYGKQ